MALMLTETKSQFHSESGIFPPNWEAKLKEGNTQKASDSDHNKKIINLKILAR